jgi:hypothetical protein
MSNVFANRMNWQFDDDTGMPNKLVGFDATQATAHNKGKPAAIRALRKQHPYQTVVMIGDGITDLEAAQEEGGADLFIGYGGIVVCSTSFPKGLLYFCRKALKVIELHPLCHEMIDSFHWRHRTATCVFCAPCVARMEALVIVRVSRVSMHSLGQIPYCIITRRR